MEFVVGVRIKRRGARPEFIDKLDLAKVHLLYKVSTP